MIHKTISMSRLAMCGQIVNTKESSRAWKDKKGNIIVDCPECLRLMSERTKKIFRKKTNIKLKEAL